MTQRSESNILPSSRVQIATLTELDPTGSLCQKVIEHQEVQGLRNRLRVNPATLATRSMTVLKPQRLFLDHLRTVHNVADDRLGFSS